MKILGTSRLGTLIQTDYYACYVQVGRLVEKDGKLEGRQRYKPTISPGVTHGNAEDFSQVPAF